MLVRTHAGPISKLNNMTNAYLKCQSDNFLSSCEQGFRGFLFIGTGRGHNQEKYHILKLAPILKAFERVIYYIKG